MRTLDKNPAWKGDRAGYKAIHEWLRKNFGSARRCENLNCPRTSKNYQWAKKIGYEYTHNRWAFLMLCIPCHKRYDYTEEIGRNLSKSKEGRKNCWKEPESVIKRLSAKAKTRSRDEVGKFIKEHNFQKVNLSFVTE